MGFRILSSEAPAEEPSADTGAPASDTASPPPPAPKFRILPAAPPPPKTALEAMPSATQSQSALIDAAIKQATDPQSTLRFAGDRLANAAISVPGLPADVASLAAQYVDYPELLPFIGPAVRAEKARQASEGADSMVPLGGENIRQAFQDLGVVAKPRAPKGIGEKWLGNVADFAGSMFGPGSIAKALLPGKGGFSTLLGATGLTAAQEAGLSPFWQFMAALGGGASPAAIEAGVKAIPKAIKTVDKSVIDPLRAAGQEARAGEIMLRAGARPKPEAQWQISPIEGVNLTAGQALDDEALLGLQKAHEAKTGEVAMPFKERPAEVQSVLRTALEELRSADLPAEAKLFAESKLQEASRAMEETLDLIGSPQMRGAATPGEARATSSAQARQRIGNIREGMRKQETELFEKGWAKEAMVDAAEVQAVLQNWLKGQPVAFQNKLPPDVKATLARLLPEEAADEVSDAAKILGVESVDVIRPAETPTALSASQQATGSAVGSPLGQMIQKAQTERTKGAFDRQFVDEAAEAGEDAASTSMVPLAEINPIKTMLREEAQRARAGGFANDARIYDELGDQLEGYLEGALTKLPDQSLMADRDRAIAFSRNRAQLFDRVPEMRALFGRDTKGGARLAPEQALEKFVKEGGLGRDSIGKLLAVDSSPEMQGLVRDFLLAAMPEDAAGAAKYLKKYGAALGQMPIIRNQLQYVADMRAATEAIRQSPLGMFADLTPQQVVGKILEAPNAPAVAQKLREMMVNNPAAWNGMRTAYVDHVLSTVENLRVQDSLQRPALRSHHLAQFNKQNDPVTRIFLGPEGAKTLKDIEKSAVLSEKTGKFAGSPTQPLQASERFIDDMSRMFLLGQGRGLLRPVANWLYGQSEERVRALLAQALLNPKLANELMQKADARGLAAVSPSTRTWLEALTPGAGTARNVDRSLRGTYAAGQSQAEQAEPLPQPLDLTGPQLVPVNEQIEVEPRNWLDRE